MGPGVDTQNSVFEVVSGSNNYGTKATTTTSDGLHRSGRKGGSMWCFQDVWVANAGEALEVRVLPEPVLRDHQRDADGAKIATHHRHHRQPISQPADFRRGSVDGAIHRQSSSGLVARDWDFGDGSTHGTDQNPTHTTRTLDDSPSHSPSLVAAASLATRARRFRSPHRRLHRWLVRCWTLIWCRDKQHESGLRRREKRPMTIGICIVGMTATEAIGPLGR